MKKTGVGMRLGQNNCLSDLRRDVSSRYPRSRRRENRRLNGWSVRIATIWYNSGEDSWRGTPLCILGSFIAGNCNDIAESRPHRWNRQFLTWLVSSVTAGCESACEQKNGCEYPDCRRQDGKRVTVLPCGAPVGRALKHCLARAAGLAVVASAAVYVLAYFLFTIHEEIGISADAAPPLALWCFPIAFLGSLFTFLLRNGRSLRPRRHQ